MPVFTPANTAAPGSDALIKGAGIAGIIVFALYFFVLVRPVNPFAAFIPYELAVLSSALLLGYGLARRAWIYVGVGTLAFLFFAVIGWAYFPLTVTGCQELLANGRPRNLAF